MKESTLIIFAVVTPGISTRKLVWTAVEPNVDHHMEQIGLTRNEQAAGALRSGLFPAATFPGKLQTMPARAKRQNEFKRSEWKCAPAHSASACLIWRHEM